MAPLAVIIVPAPQLTGVEDTLIVDAVVETVTTAVVVAPPHALVVYVIIAVPADTAVTMPVVDAIEAIPGDELLQVPPVAVLVSKDDEPRHISIVPDIVPALAVAVNVTVVSTDDEQPPDGTKVMTAVPAESPVTAPPGVTVPIAGLEDDQVPPPGVAESVRVDPTHVVVGPVTLVAPVPTVS